MEIEPSAETLVLLRLNAAGILRQNTWASQVAMATLVSRDQVVLQPPSQPRGTHRRHHNGGCHCLRR
jgi:hypothetical protein